MSPDVELRTDQSTAIPTPSLFAQIQLHLDALRQKAMLAVNGMNNLRQGRDVYAQAPVDPNFYQPGRDAASLPLTPQQAASIRALVSQRFNVGR
jgi:hypothetical protein